MSKDDDHPVGSEPNQLSFVQRARGLQFRKGEDVAGFFSQIGDLYTVHHVWGEYVGVMIGSHALHST